MNILEYENTQETKAHGEPEFPFNIYPCSIPLDFPAVPTHWHNDMEIIYVKKGAGQVLVDLVPYAVKAGDIVFVYPGQLHSIEQAEGACMEYENIIFQLGLLIGSGEDLCNRQFFAPLLHNRITLPVYLPPELPIYPEVNRCLNRLDALSGCKEAPRALGVKGQLFELFYLLFRHFPNTTPTRRSSRSLDSMKLIVKHVETHYPEKLSIRDMADLCGFSCSHFMKFFKQHMGTPFTSYLNDYRLTMAARMLTASQDAVSAVAAECGFENLSYFNRLFRRKFGVTPTQYRG